MMMPHRFVQHFVFADITSEAVARAMGSLQTSLQLMMICYLQFREGIVGKVFCTPLLKIINFSFKTSVSNVVEKSSIYVCIKEWRCLLHKQL